VLLPSIFHAGKQSSGACQPNLLEAKVKIDLSPFRGYHAAPVEERLVYDQTSARAVGWEIFRNWLSSLAVTPQGKQLCLQLQPWACADEISRRGRQLDVLKELEEKNLPPPLQAIEQIEDELSRAEKGGRLTPEEIIKIARAMTVCASVRRYLLKGGDDTLVDLAAGTEDLHPLGRDLGRAFDENGQLRDSASPELGELRRKARMLADHIRARLEKLIRRPQLAQSLQDSYITERNSRYVIPVRADAPEKIPGIVHDTSQSGATLFVEPAELVEDGNRLKIVQNEVLEHESVILSEYSHEIGQAAGAIRKNLEMLAQADLLWAMRQAEKTWQGQRPQLGGGELMLRSARHAELLIAGREAVASDLEVTGGKRCLVISGPNAGGKTVALKTIGLTVMLAQAGLSPPLAAGSRLPVFRKLFVVMGDEQDLVRGLSSFTGQLLRLLEVIRQVGPDSLVLLDEIMADTDPEQGAALAIQLLRVMADRGAMVVVTTHFEALKRLAYVDQRFANASVGFDMGRFRPDYTLHPGVPGRSLTFDIARSLGVTEELLEQAGQWLSQEKKAAEQMLQQLEQERQQLRALQQQCRQQLEQLKLRNDEIAQTSQQLREQQQVIRRQGREQLLGEIREARRLVAQMIENLKKEADPRELTRAGQKLKQMEEDLLRPPPQPVSEKAFQPGDWVAVEGYQTSGQIISLDRKGASALVRLGNIESRLPLSLLRPAAAAASHKRRDSDRSPARTHSLDLPRLSTSDNTLDLRGLRVDEAVAALEKFLDSLWASGQQQAYVIHGHGNGVLRQAVREYLARCPYRNQFRPGEIEEGGDGVTVVNLK